VNKKHRSLVARLQKQLTKTQVAFGLLAVRAQEMQAHLDEDAVAIGFPKKGKITKKEMRKDIVRAHKGGFRRANYTRG
jgi:hypothetical protein